MARNGPRILSLQKNVDHRKNAGMWISMLEGEGKGIHSRKALHTCEHMAGVEHE